MDDRLASGVDTRPLSGQTILVTGGAGRLARTWIAAIHAAGGSVFSLDLVPPDPAVGCEQWAVLDLTDVTTLHTWCETHACRLDGVVNNAAYNPSPSERTVHDAWDRQMALLTAARNITRWCSSHWTVRSRTPQGLIVNIASDLGLQAPNPQLYEDRGMKPDHYTVAKHALIGLTRHYAALLAPHIRVNALCPGPVHFEQDEVFVKRVADTIPLRRLAQASELGDALIFLLSSASSYMTGSCLILDGGRTII